MKRCGPASGSRTASRSNSLPLPWNSPCRWSTSPSSPIRSSTPSSWLLRRPTVQSFRGASHAFQLPSALLAQLRRLSQEAGCTLFMTLLATFQLLLARYSGQQDILVGTPVVGRTLPELEGLVGCFVNTLVLR